METRTILGAALVLSFTLIACENPRSAADDARSGSAQAGRGGSGASMSSKSTKSSASTQAPRSSSRHTPDEADAGRADEDAGTSACSDSVDGGDCWPDTPDTDVDPDTDDYPPGPRLDAGAADLDPRDCLGEIVLDPSDCILDDAYCVRLSNGLWCTGSEAPVCPEGYHPMAPEDSCKPGYDCIQYSESLRCESEERC